MIFLGSFITIYISLYFRLDDTWKTPLIQQGVVNGDPDMDAIFRLTRKRTLTPLDVKFDPAAPPVIVPEGVFSPFNSQNTLFHYDALWALLLPTTTTFRICDIWRGYWAQRLLWEIGGQLGFFPPNAYQMRNAHNYMSDAEDEKDMYFDTDRLIDFLSSWSCPKHMTFFQCVELLSADMATEGFWGQADADVTQLWLEDLRNIGYSPPVRVNVDFVLNKNSGKPRVTSNVTWRGNHVNFVAVEQRPPMIHAMSEEWRNNGDITTHIAQVSKLCPTITDFHDEKHAVTAQSSLVFHDVALVVMFNWPEYDNVRYIEVMHRNLFPVIIYCGDNANKFANATMGIERGLSFIDIPVVKGDRGYRCMVGAARMSFNVSGFLLIGDDTLVNTWQFQGMDKSKVWMMEPNFQKCSSGTVKQSVSGTKWEWWNDRSEGQKLISVLGDLQKKLDLPEMQRDPHLPKFFSNLRDNTGTIDGCVHGVSDIFYVPKTHAVAMTTVFNHFDSHHQVLELVAPITLYGLANKSNILIIRGRNLWESDRNNPWAFYDPEGSHFLHPVKLSNSTNVQILCQVHLPNLLRKSYGARLSNITKR